MTYLYIILAVIVLALLYMRFEAGFFEVKRIKLTKNKKHLKVIQLSDIHINFIRVPAEKVREVLKKENPDLVLMTGDYIETPKNTEKFLKYLDAIKNGSTICLCLGNHDYRAFEDNEPGLAEFINDIESRGVNVLHNQCMLFEKNSKRYNIIGIGDLRSEHDDIEEALNSCNKGTDLNIAFSHNPDIALKIPKGKVDYLFCGHFHGGQIWLPFNLEYKMLRKDKLCKTGVRKGMHKINGINLYINRGLGNVLFPLRFLSRPEITVFHMP